MHTPEGKERRGSSRKPMNEAAELFIPDEGWTLPCLVMDMSATGAKVKCDAIPPSGTPVVLIFESGISIDAVTTRFGGGELALKFLTPQPVCSG